MAARTTPVSATHTHGSALLGWATPLIALGLLGGIFVVKHNAHTAAKAPVAAAMPAPLAGAGIAIMYTATFY